VHGAALAAPARKNARARPRVKVVVRREACSRARFSRQKSHLASRLE
jgi:hypothetical protein